MKSTSTIVSLFIFLLFISGHFCENIDVIDGTVQINDLRTIDKIFIKNGVLEFTASALTPITDGLTTIIELTGNCEIIAHTTDTIDLSALKIVILPDPNTITQIAPTLKLNNIKLTLTGNFVVNELKIVMATSTTQFITETGSRVEFRYDETLTETGIFLGGKIIIKTGSLFTMQSFASKVLKVQSKIDNRGQLETSFLLSINLFDLVVNTGTLTAPSGQFYFHGGIKTLATYSSSEVLNLIGVYIRLSNLMNLGGATLFLDASTIDVRNSSLSVQNTHIVLGQPCTINVGRSSAAVPLGSLVLDSQSTFFVSLANSLKISYIVKSDYNPLAYPSSDSIIYSTTGLNPINCGSFRGGSDIGYVTFQLANKKPKLKGYVYCSSRVISVRANIAGPTDYNEIDDICQEGYYQCFAQQQCSPFDSLCLIACGPGSLVAGNPVISNATSIANATAIARSSATNDALTMNTVIAGICWNGDCLDTYPVCPAFPACGTLKPKRCAGRCVAVDEPCNDVCVSRCVDGCYDYPRQCAEFYGCSLDQISCPDRSCANTLAECPVLPPSCSTNPSECWVPTQKKVLTSISNAFPNSLSLVPSWYYDTESGYGSPSFQVEIPQNSFTNPGVNGIPTSPDPYALVYIQDIPDSVVRNIPLPTVTGFSYYTDIHTSVFSISLDKQASTVFTQEVKILFPKPATVDAANLNHYCLGFISYSGPTPVWECTNTPLTINAEGMLVGSTPHFTNFGVLTKYRPAPTTTTSSTTDFQSFTTTSQTTYYGDEIDNPPSEQSTNTNRIIIISASVVGALLIVAILAAAYVNFKQKHVSLRRWTVRRSDPNLERHLRALRESNMSSTSSNSV